MRVLKVSPKNFKKIIKQITGSIKRGEVIICPTDTVYGLVCDATNKVAVRKLFKIKKRPIQKTVPIFVKDIKMAKELAEINNLQEKFLKKVWPGRITLVLKRRKSKIKIYGVDKKTIGLRIPNYRLLNILLKKLNRPLTGTSANISGRSASRKIREILEQFKNQKPQPDLVLDAGNLKPTSSSTIIDLTHKKPKILRV